MTTFIIYGVLNDSPMFMVYKTLHDATTEADEFLHNASSFCYTNLRIAEVTGLDWKEFKMGHPLVATPVERTEWLPE